MKTITTLAVMILIMLSHGACRTRKLTGREQSRLDIEERADTKSRVQEVNRLAVSRTITDSSGQSYQLTIYPADTFTFSMENGFTGKALKVVLNGFLKQQLRISGTSNVNKTMTYETEASRSSDLTERNKTREAALERTGIMSKGLVIGLIVLLIILGLLWKFRQRHSYF